MWSFIKEYQAASTLLLTLLTLFLLISFQVSGGREGSLTEGNVYRLVSPFLRASYFLVDRCRKGISHFLFLTQVTKENRLLRQHIGELQIKQQKLDNLRQENQDLRRLLGLQETLSTKTMIGEVIAKDLSNPFRSLVINRGARDGLRRGQAVLVGEGVVGRIQTVTAHTARVHLVTNSQSGLSVRDLRSRVEGIISGTDENILLMKYVAEDADILLEDEIITTGYGGIYPEGYSVGRILKVDQTAFHTLLIQVEPSVHFNTIEYVFVLLAEPVLPT